MARKATGQVIERRRGDRTVYALRFRALGERRYVTLGSSADSPPWTRARAEAELANVLADVRRGLWQLPAPEPEPQVDRNPTFHEFATEWFEGKRREVAPATEAAYFWELTHHLLPFFGAYRLSHIDVTLVDRYRDEKVRQRERGECRLSNGTINVTIRRLGQVLDVAHERGLVAVNPVRVNPRNRKLKAPKAQMPWLEPDQVVALLAAAGELDAADARSLPVRRPLLATLAWAGLRVQEAIDLRWRDVDLAGGTIHVRRSKTDAGVREVDLQPELRDVLAPWRSRTPFAASDDLVFPARNGKARDRHNVRQQIVLRSARRASAALVEAGHQPLPDGLSPHALRRSFASWLFVEGEDVPYVMQQMGHTQPDVTLGIYARAVRSGRTSARSRRRAEVFAAPADWAPMGTSGGGGAQAADRASAA